MCLDISEETHSIFAFWVVAYGRFDYTLIAFTLTFVFCLSFVNNIGKTIFKQPRRPIGLPDQILGRF